MRTVHIVLLVALAAVIGFSIFGVLVWRAVETEEVAMEPALSRFDEIRSRYGGRPPLVDLDDRGSVTSRRSSSGTSEPVKKMSVLVYRGNSGKLISADVPFWFVKLKGPAARFAFRGTGFDLDRLGLTAKDLERYGPGLILDESSAGGDRILVWLE